MHRAHCSCGVKKLAVRYEAIDEGSTGGHSRNDSTVVCMYNSGYHVEQAVARERSCAEVFLVFWHELASRGIDLGKVLAEDEECRELGTTDSSIEDECRDERL